jgi:sulfite exporter TauE/SafE
MFAVQISTGFFMGLAASLHCMGMCGPLNILINGNQTINTQYIFFTGIYHIGRILMYILIGLLFGFFSSFLNLQYIQNFASFLAAFVILIYLTTSLSKKIEHWVSQTYIYTKVQQLLSTFITQNTYQSKLVSGLLNGLLPCGLVYLAATTAALSSTVIQGATFMLFFGLGTLPALVLLPLFVSSLQLKKYSYFKYLSSALLLLVCIIFIIRGLNLSGIVMQWFGSEDAVCH